MIYSFDEKGTICLKAFCDCSYNGKDYKKGDILAFFTDVICTLEYASQEKSPNSGPLTYLSHVQMRPDRLTIREIHQQDSLLNLFFRKQEEKTVKVTNNIRLEAVRTQMTIFSQYDIDYSSIKVFNLEKEVVPHSISEGNKIEVEKDGFYTVFYDEIIPVISQYKGEDSLYANYSLQFISAGNVNGETSYKVLDVKRISLVSPPSPLGLGNEGYSATLIFQILSGEDITISYI